MVSKIDTLSKGLYQNMNIENSADIKSALKQLMKQQKRSYMDLAEHLGISHVSVKRILSKEELSLSRFLSICEWLNVTLADVEKIAKYGTSQKKIYFTEKQEAFLAKNPAYMAFLFQMYTDETPEKIQKKYGLTTKSLSLYLVRLEKHDLIKKVGERYEPASKQFPSPLAFGELSKSQTYQVIDSGAALFKRHRQQMNIRRDSEADKGNLVHLSVMGIKRESYLEWLEKYRELMKELSAISAYQEKTVHETEMKTLVTLHMHAVIANDDSEIEGIKNMFGRITNIN